MKKHLHLFFFCLGILLWPMAMKAQVINMEETWKKFLREPKTASISKLIKPEKADKHNYSKFCLMYANDRFCNGNLPDAEMYIKEIKTVGVAEYSKIAGFKARFDDLDLKIRAYYSVDKLWEKYIASQNVSQADIKRNAIGGKVCERSTLGKYAYMSLRASYCKGDVTAAAKIYNGRLKNLRKSAIFNPKKINGMTEELAIVDELFPALIKLDAAWKKFTSTGESPGFNTALPLIDCYPIPTIKELLLKAAVNPCKNGSKLLKRIQSLSSSTDHEVPADVQEKIDWLEAIVNKENTNLASLKKAWKAFVPASKVPADAKYGYEYCDKANTVRAHIMDGMKDPCIGGEDALAKIKTVQQEHKPTLDATTKTKLKELQALVAKENKALAQIKAAWKEFTPKDTIKSGAKYGYEYCDKANTIRAYVMTGMMNACDKGQEMMNNIVKVQDEHQPELDELTVKKVEKLQARVAKLQEHSDTLNALWTTFIDQKDTILRSYQLAEFYCDKIEQVKSWTIKGHFNPCDDGQTYLNKIAALKRKHKLRFDKELSCRVLRLRRKVYKCIYMKLVYQARKETHEERERFGPKSAEIMKMDLNSDKLPCETTVEYEPLGNIGVKYTIKTFLCERINLAKMGDPEYYKKIAAWVDTEVLSKYCEANMRCKKDFFIYLEGHTDGNRFSGRSYKKSLGIPQDYPYTHFVNNDTLQKKTDRAITTKLKNNMELGLARAWTVKQQLDFMNVPIKVGAYEHPAAEKGGEFRRIEIQLNITNLLLDFYEKRLAELVKEAGIGDWPPKC